MLNYNALQLRINLMTVNIFLQLDCWDALVETVKIETLNQDHFETNRDPKAYNDVKETPLHQFIIFLSLVLVMKYFFDYYLQRVMNTFSRKVIFAIVMNCYLPSGCSSTYWNEMKSSPIHIVKDYTVLKIKSLFKHETDSFRH